MTDELDEAMARVARALSARKRYVSADGKKLCWTCGRREPEPTQLECKSCLSPVMKALPPVPSFHDQKEWDTQMMGADPEQDGR